MTFRLLPMDDKSSTESIHIEKFCSYRSTFFLLRDKGDGVGGGREEG